MQGKGSGPLADCKIPVIRLHVRVTATNANAPQEYGAFFRVPSGTARFKTGPEYVLRDYVRKLLGWRHFSSLR